MREINFYIEPMAQMTLQGQIREMLVTAITTGQLPPGSALPSTRMLSKQLKLSRNTVSLAYQSLEADGFIRAVSRSGYYVCEQISTHSVVRPTPEFDTPKPHSDPRLAPNKIDWKNKLAFMPSGQVNIHKPRNWHQYPYPFLGGQSDLTLFPVSSWRDCMRQAMTRKRIEQWTDDMIIEDDTNLITQIRHRILLSRGVHAREDEVLITLGAQNAVYLAAYLLTGAKTVLAMENPGYPDVRNLFDWLAGRTEYGCVHNCDVDEQGLEVDKLEPANVLYFTPSHQVPLGFTMTLQRRMALLEWAGKNDAILIEDDYDFELNCRDSLPALKSLDQEGRVIYAGSFSKSVMPGLRLGFLVGPALFINEARALRRLCLRHAPGNNQSALALFLALGHYDSYVSRLKRAYKTRNEFLGKALQKHFPGWSVRGSPDGIAYWLKGPDALDSRAFALKALKKGVIIEPGGVYFAQPEAHHQHLRLGFSCISEDKIDEGISQLAELAKAEGFSGVC